MIRNVLLCDDNPDNLFLLHTILEEFGYHVDIASNGEEVLNRIEVEIPDLLILDLFMPGMNGYDVARFIRKHPSFKSLPVLLITTSSSSRITKKCRNYVNEVVEKPIDLEVLHAKVLYLEAKCCHN
ncbi:MAG: response regulator [Mastigocoleus sp.]|mgnify:CR=1 FL=1